MVHLEVLKGEVRVERDIRVVIYVGFVPHVFFSLPRSAKVPAEVQGQIISATVWLAGMKGRTCSV